MDMFYIGFRDPLFSIILFFTIIFLIAFFSYWWGRYRRKKNTKSLDSFLEQFRALPSENELKILISSGELSQKSWMLLASSYSRNGEYEKSIEIYNELLKVSEKEHIFEIMFILGKTYFKAGFLERSRQIFLEILKYNPRTPQALEYLLLVYEYMRDYKSAIDVVESLDALEQDIVLERSYLMALSTLQDMELSEVQKCDKLLAIYKENQKIPYMIFEALLRLNPQLAWEHLPLDDVTPLTELFWRLDSKELNLDIISKSRYLQELYTARGDVTFVAKSSIFEFNVLIGLQGITNANATLGFEYVCSKCKATNPFAFTRCSSCHTLDSAMVEYLLTKDYSKEFSEENNSFQ